MNIDINLIYIILFLIIAIVIFLFHNGFSLNLFAKHDQKVIDAFLEKYPDVTEIFCKLPLREQNIENNQEIHEINKRLAAIEKRLKNG